MFNPYPSTSGCWSWRIVIALPLTVATISSFDGTDDSRGVSVDAAVDALALAMGSLAWGDGIWRGAGGVVDADVRFDPQPQISIAPAMKTRLARIKMGFSWWTSRVERRSRR